MSSRQDGHAMHCMEIRGGSQAVEEAVSTPGLEAWVYSRPHEEAESGGDVHYVSLCGGGIITRLIVADVSGHGASVAEFSASLRTLMRKNINTKSQTRLVRALNRQFAESAEMQRFATAVVATYLAHRRQLTVCNAGHPRPLLRRADSGTWEFLDQGASGAANLPLGLDDETAYDQVTVSLGTGDLVVFYTDALTEATDPSGHLIGEAGLLSLAQGIDSDDPIGVGRALLEGIGTYRGGGLADDDVTLLVLRHDGGGPKRLSVTEKIDVYAKVFGLKSY